MERDFDFDDIGKKTPYRVPEGFFDEMQRNIRKRTYGTHSTSRRLWITLSAGVAAAAVVAGLLFVPLHSGQDGSSGDVQVLEAGNRTATALADKWIYEISDEELEELVSFSENDIFLN